MKCLIVANWKMNPATWREAKALFDATRKAVDDTKKGTIIIAPPALYLRELKARYKGRRIFFAAQHAHAAESGAFTGELSMSQAADAGAQYVLVGHAERRERGETNEDTGKKVAAAFDKGLTPILCVGEKERSGAGDHYVTVKEQLRAALSSAPPASVKKVIITYEPLWTIGAQKAMSSREMHEMAIFIRKTIVEMCGEAGHKVKILYGGAVDETNVRDMLENGDVHGPLVGRASQNADKFAALMRAIGGA